MTTRERASRPWFALVIAGLSVAVSLTLGAYGVAALTGFDTTAAVVAFGAVVTALLVAELAELRALVYARDAAGWRKRSAALVIFALCGAVTVSAGHYGVQQISRKMVAAERDGLAEEAARTAATLAAAAAQLEAFDARTREELAPTLEALRATPPVSADNRRARAVLSAERDALSARQTEARAPLARAHATAQTAAAGAAAKLEAAPVGLPHWLPLVLALLVLMLKGPLVWSAEPEPPAAAPSRVFDLEALRRLGPEERAALTKQAAQFLAAARGFDRQTA